MHTHLDAEGSDLLREMVQTFAERLMAAEVDVLCNAGYGEVTPEPQRDPKAGQAQLGRVVIDGVELLPTRRSRHGALNDTVQIGQLEPGDAISFASRSTFIATSSPSLRPCRALDRLIASDATDGSETDATGVQSMEPPCRRDHHIRPTDAPCSTGEPGRGKGPAR